MAGERAGASCEWYWRAVSCFQNIKQFATELHPDAGHGSNRVFVWCGRIFELILKRRRRRIHDGSRSVVNIGGDHVTLFPQC